MKYVFVIAFMIALASGCTKNDCVQCSRQVKATSQTSNVYTDYNIVYVGYCGRQADSAMSQNASTYQYFVGEHDLQPYSCFYNQ